MDYFDTDDSLVLNKLLKLKDNKVLGDDGPTKLLKELAFVISSPLTLIFRQSLYACNMFSKYKVTAVYMHLYMA